MSLPLSVADFFFSCLFLSFTSSHSVCFRQRGFCGLFGCLLFLPHARLVSVSRLGFDFAFGLLSSLCWCWRGRLALASLCHHPLPKHAVLVSLACSCSSCSTSWCKWDLFPFLSVFFFSLGSASVQIQEMKAVGRVSCAWGALQLVSAKAVWSLSKITQGQDAANRRSVIVRIFVYLCVLV